MPQVDFVISNDGHHTAMFLPVVKALAAMPDYECRVISLCEFRGFISPVEKFEMRRVSFVKVLPFRFRSSPSVGRQTGSEHSQAARELARSVSWRFLLERKFQACFEGPPDLVVLPNDTAFPYNCICRLLKSRQIPFLLVQEGIRFPLPGAARKETYGQGGAAAIAAWGETSAAYFRSQGVPNDRIHLTGNPRFEIILKTDWQSEANRLKDHWKLGKINLLFLSNPIDDQGFCTTKEKLELVRRFIRGIALLFEDPDFSLIVKLHPRESVKDFMVLITDLPFAHRVVILGACPLYPLFALSQAAIVLASTAGLEALLFGLPLGVLEIPQVGFVYDYVSSGAAQGLTWSDPLADQVRALLESPLRNKQSAEAYVAHNLASLEGATEQIMNLIIDLVKGRPIIIGHAPRREWSGVI
jgi:hypothetical protein